MIVIGLFYKETELTVRPIYMTIVIGAICLAFICNTWLKIRKWWFYIFIIGTISWIGFLWTAIHPALALVPIIPFMLISNKSPYNHVNEHDESEISGRY